MKCQSYSFFRGSDYLRIEAISQFFQPFCLTKQHLKGQHGGLRPPLYRGGGVREDSCTRGKLRKDGSRESAAAAGSLASMG